MMTRMDLNALIVEVLALYETSSARIARRLAPALPPVYADPAQIRQVLHNLLQNAQDALAGRDEPRIEVGTEAAGERVRFTVADNGAGFQMEYGHKLFHAFQRLHGVSEFEGTGVGLATVQRIVRRHGGHVWAEGKPGQGATFYFTLPPVS